MPSGIIFSNGLTWKQQRRIGVTSLRKLGLGKKSIEHQIEDAAQVLVEIFRQTKGQPFDPSFSVLNVVSNVICALSFGHQFSAEDEEFQKLVQALKIILKFVGHFFHVVYDLFPQLMKYLPGPHKKALASLDIILAFAKQEIEKHKESHSLHEPQDFIDYYLLQMQKVWIYCGSIHGQRIISFFRKHEASVFIIIIFPEKVQKEIEDVFGSSGSISYQDRKKLPYTNAMIHEMQRVKYALFYGIPRQSKNYVTIRGYHIPKGTFIIPDLHSVLLDPEQWEIPEKFNPNNFLDKDGKFIDREEFLLFGLGKRSCVGEQLARIEIFIFLTSLLRAFNFRLPEGVKELNEAPVVKLIMHPNPYKLCAIPTQV
ncbi:cytochrome P450 2J5-like [Notechis scutatus]|uniref:Cytochrome P450 2J5-like n=1 Tax=Notechis scutatus TaxID=8663 RepID=A0A6J1VTU4_9SAUR|nr:cytochrome P450 2J5-like [Notechis scutatus]